MKKFLKYTLILLVVIVVAVFALMSFFVGDIEDVLEEDRKNKVDNFLSDASIKTQLQNDINEIETSLSDFGSDKLSEILKELEKQYPENSDVINLRESFNSALIKQENYIAQYKKELEEKARQEREEKERQRQEQERQNIANTINNKKIVVTAVCNRQTPISAYMRFMENLRTSEALQLLRNEVDCYNPATDGSNNDIFTRNNSTVMMKGNFYLTLFNGNKYASTTIDAYDNP